VMLFAIFALDAVAASAPVFTSLYSFGGYAHDAASPKNPLVIDNNGVLYGTTFSGGNYGGGTVFALTPPSVPGGSWTEAVLWSFGGAGDLLAGPSGGALVGPDGVLYGNVGGGTYGHGAVFSLLPPASPGSPWTETSLYSFMGGTDGIDPVGPLAIDKKGVLYGTTWNGGNQSWGTVFRLAPPAAAGGPWTESVLYRSTGGSDGINPVAGVVIGGGGVLYGTTLQGGSDGNGTVFSLSPPISPGNPWIETILHSFTVADGLRPTAGVIIGSDGVLYGTTSGGGGLGGGVAFSLTPPGSPGGDWAEAVLNNFGTGHRKGFDPMGGLVPYGNSGALYGATSYTHYDGDGNGIVYELKPPASPGGIWTVHVLHYFTGTDGEHPLAGLAKGGGIFYGTTSAGGANNAGTVFSVKP
jgi:uncharacterized repeat protein (TIGR03803 family)